MMLSRKKKAVFLGGALSLVLVGTELILQLLAMVSPTVDRHLSRVRVIEPIVDDDRLGWRPNPDDPEHDARGFRNCAVPAAVTIVALGDSNTYGTNVEREQAWPQQLERLSGHATYNMACGGYGPVHGLLLTAEAHAFGPAVVIDAFYAGNDLYDAYSLVYDNNMAPELRSSDPAVLERIAEAERTEPLQQRIERVFLGGAVPTEPPPATHGPVRDLLARRSKVYGLLRLAKHVYTSRHIDPAVLAPPTWADRRHQARQHPEYFEILEQDDLRTVLTPTYRAVAVDLSDARIAEGHRLCLDAMRAMARQAAARNIRFVVLGIPTKELVYKEAAERAPGGLPATMAALVENEERLWRKTRRFLADAGIPFFDALPALRAGLDADASPYAMSSDGHPRAAGHRILANLVWSGIQEQGLLD
jgi:lysophospholipase L1-like esterase